VEHKVISAGKGDRLRAEPRPTYLEMFAGHDPMEHPALAGLTPEQLTGIVQTGAGVLSVEDRKKRAEAYSTMPDGSPTPPNHQWLKGIAAAALIMKELEITGEQPEEEEPEGAQELVEEVTGETVNEAEVEELEANADETGDGEQDTQDSDESDESQS
jgi:hypothetical protein